VTFDGTSDVVIRADGNVGIGETDPSATLYVDGTVTLEDFVSCTALETNGSGVLTCGSDDSGVSSVRYDQILDPGTHSGENFAAFTNSWTYTGTTTDFFDVTANSLTTADAININVAATNTTGDAIEINRGGTKVAGIDGFGQLTVAGFTGSTRMNSGVNFAAFTNIWTATNADSPFFRIDATNDFVVRADGNVGIGDTDPSSRLRVAGSFSGAITEVSGNTTLDDTHYAVMVDASGGDITISLPAASGLAGRMYYIKKIAGATSNVVTIDPSGAELIDDAATKDLSNNYQAATIICDGDEWYIL
jgi:hypothetical protein